MLSNRFLFLDLSLLSYRNKNHKMTDKTYRIWNLNWGWAVFTIALFTFGSTVEPTASFWDAGEYIATSAKLQIGHPPGAPLFQMLGAFFAAFAARIFAM